MPAVRSSTPPSDRRRSIEYMLLALSDGPGDLWSILLAAAAFALLFLLLKLLERV